VGGSGGAEEERQLEVSEVERQQRSGVEEDIWEAGGGGVLGFVRG